MTLEEEKYFPVFSSRREILPGYYIPDLVLCRVLTGFEQEH